MYHNHSMLLLAPFHLFLETRISPILPPPTSTLNFYEWCFLIISPIPHFITNIPNSTSDLVFLIYYYYYYYYYYSFPLLPTLSCVTVT